MNCGGIEEEEDIISSTSASSSPGRVHRGHEHSPSSATASTTVSSLSIDLNHHSPAASNSSPCSVITRDYEPPCGLNLLVAALDAQDCPSDQNKNRFDGENSLGQHSSSASDEEISGKKVTLDRKLSVPDCSKDEAYWEKRRRNNEAAKRSREKRRVSDMAMEARLMELSRENNLLRHELDSVRKHKLTSSPSSPFLCTPNNPEIPPVAQAPPEISSRMVPISPNHSLTSTSTTMVPFSSLPAPRPPFLPNAAAAASFMNPLLAAVVPPAVLLQAIAQQQQHQQRPSPSPPMPIRPIGKRYAPFPMSESLSIGQNLSMLNGEQRQQTPATPMLAAALSAPTSPGPPPLPPTSADGKQYLRYKLLERQLQQQHLAGLTGSSRGLNLLGSVISTTATPPKQPHQRSASISIATTCPPPSAKRQRVTAPPIQATTKLTNPNADSSLSLKECLSSLAVSLMAPSANSTSDKPSPNDTAPTNDDQHHSVQSNELPPLSIVEDMGDLLRARTHSDSSHSSAGISNHSSSSSAGPANTADMEYRRSFSSDQRRSSNNSDSGVVSDGASEARWSLSNSTKRYRSEHERYMERRRRNNEAAKRCRANRRAMFEYRFRRAQELETENSRLKEEMRMLSQELAELKEMLAKRDEYTFQNVNKADLVQHIRSNGLGDVSNLGDGGGFVRRSVNEEVKMEEVSVDMDDGHAEETPLDFTVKKD